MTQKKFGNTGSNRATLAGIAEEMAKPRMTQSARKAAVVESGPKIQGTIKIDLKVVAIDVPKSARQPPDRRLDEEALLRMDDEGGPTHRTPKPLVGRSNFD